MPVQGNRYSSAKRTLWLSFADPTKPKGKTFLGVVVVDVLKFEADEFLRENPDMYDKVDGPYLMAATQKCFHAGCNPGGEVASFQVDPQDFHGVPRLTLMAAAELERRKLI